MGVVLVCTGEPWLHGILGSTCMITCGSERKRGRDGLLGGTCIDCVRQQKKSGRGVEGEGGLRLGYISYIA